MRHLGTRELNTPRLVLRRLTAANADQMYTNWASDPEVTRYLRWSPHESPQATAALLREWEREYASGRVMQKAGFV